jgi:phytoene dehydrogenase-like protein
VEHFDVGIIGSGMGSLTAAALLAQRGLKVHIAEQNYLPGGCTSSYWRKGFIFETGATTIVGLDENMPLKYLLDQIGIDIPMRKLGLPMQVHFNGTTINKYENLENWIEEAERIFGKSGQRQFWEKCYDISQFVWNTSIKQRFFPPTSMGDLFQSAKNASIKQLLYARFSLKSMETMLREHGLLNNPQFVKYVNEQLLITAQNSMADVNMLFGATALCYTNYGNYYVDGGLINLVTPIINYIESNGGSIDLRTPVEMIKSKSDKYEVTTKKGLFSCEYLVSGIPLNNILRVFPEVNKVSVAKKKLESKDLNSAFQMGIGFKSERHFDTIHHQIHLPEPLVETGSQSIFVSLSHPEDPTRSDVQGYTVASVSTHIADPANRIVDNTKVEAEVITILEKHQFLQRGNIVYQHSSSAKSWEKWTGREFGFVGGYPQFMKTKPWQMKDARLDRYKAYICGDTAYPGQGIPGTTLSGIIAYEKLAADWL